MSVRLRAVTKIHIGEFQNKKTESMIHKRKN